MCRFINLYLKYINNDYDNNNTNTQNSSGFSSSASNHKWELSAHQI